MQMLEPGFECNCEAPAAVGRLSIRAQDPRIDAAVDEALEAAGLRISDVTITDDQWQRAVSTADDLIASGAAESNLHLQQVWDELEVGPSLRKGYETLQDRPRMERAYAAHEEWRRFLGGLADAYGPLALPSLACFVPALENSGQDDSRLAQFTSPVNVSGLPAVVVPVDSPTRVPVSVQFIGRWNGEAELLALASKVEAAVGFQGREALRPVT
jgi:Asp-tRNA(Asn)/Glu-tRNA(Gln) amidotransferase A subunit family amidase